MSKIFEGRRNITMNCQNHIENEATGTCVYCGKFFCSDCLVEINGKNYCRTHVSNVFNEQKETNQQGPSININNASNSISNATASNQVFAGGPNPYGISPKSRLVTLLLCFFLGAFGIHRFYNGKIGTGILYIFTGGLCGFGIVVDFILILLGSFRDSYGMPIKRW